jgi:hypothetical protein
MQQSPSREANRFPLVKKFPAFYGTRRFITAFRSACHLSLSWTSSIQSIPLHHTSWRSILILSSHLRPSLPHGLLTSGFTYQNPLYASPLPHTRYMSLPSNFLFYHPHNTGWAVQIIKPLMSTASGIKRSTFRNVWETFWVLLSLCFSYRLVKHLDKAGNLHEYVTLTRVRVTTLAVEKQ